MHLPPVKLRQTARQAEQPREPVNHGQVEVPELLQVQREGGRSLGAMGGAEGLGRENLRGGKSQILLSATVPFSTFLFNCLHVCPRCPHRVEET